MGLDDIPKTLVAQHPELAQVDEAIRAHLTGKTIEARCPTCDRFLVVTEVAEASALWVTCGSGCTAYREHYQR